MAWPSTLHLERGQREKRVRNVERLLEEDRGGHQDKEVLVGVLRSHVPRRLYTFACILPPHPGL